MSISKDEALRWTEFLRRPVLSQAVSSEETYRAACIGAITLLFEAGDCAGLADSVCHAAAPESRARALAALGNLTCPASPVRSEAIRQLHSLAILYGHPQAAEFLRKKDLADRDDGWNSARMLLFGQKHRLLKTDPGPEKLTAFFLEGNEPLRRRLLTLGEKTLPNWVLLMRFLDDPSEGNRNALSEVYKTFSPDERKLIGFCCDSPESAVRSLPADLLLDYEDGTLLELCVDHGLRPSDSSREALFYFLSGQWENYYAADSDFRRIRLAYEQNDPDLQRRLIAVSRESGNNAWLRHIGSGPEQFSGDGTLGGRHLLIRSLIEQKHWDRLWGILPTAPLLCMPEICDALQTAEFRPAHPEEAAFLNELNSRIEACEGTTPIPLIRQFYEGPGTALSLSGSGKRFAVTFSDRRILVWDTREPDAAPVCISSNRLNFRKAILSRDGRYLCADCGNDGAVIFSLPGGQAVKEIRSSGSSFSGIVLQADDRRLITVTQDGKGGVFAFPGGAEIFRFDAGIKDCILTPYETESGRICVVSFSGDCTVYDISARRPVTGLKLGGHIRTAENAYTQGKLSFIDEDGTLSCTNLLSGKRILDRLDPAPVQIRRILALSGGDLYLLGTLDGRILVYDPAAGNIPAQLTFGSRSAVTGLWLDEENQVLYGCTASAVVRAWDMKLFMDMIRVIPMLQLPGLGRISDYCKKYPEPGVKNAAEWLKTVIAWRRRFDIEVDFDE